MIGAIETTGRCPHRGHPFKYNENRSGPSYPRHPKTSFKVRCDRRLQSDNNLSNPMRRVMDAWCDLNIKADKKGHIENFHFSREMSAKTRANIKSRLNRFFVGW
jgi:hypothetical protein